MCELVKTKCWTQFQHGLVPFSCFLESFCYALRKHCDGCLGFLEFVVRKEFIQDLFLQQVLVFHCHCGLLKITIICFSNQRLWKKSQEYHLFLIFQSFQCTDNFVEFCEVCVRVFIIYTCKGLAYKTFSNLVFFFSARNFFVFQRDELDVQDYVDTVGHHYFFHYCWCCVVIYFSHFFVILRQKTLLDLTFRIFIYFSIFTELPQYSLFDFRFELQLFYRNLTSHKILKIELILNVNWLESIGKLYNY